MDQEQIPQGPKIKFEEFSNFGKHQEPPPEGAPRVGEKTPEEYAINFLDTSIYKSIDERITKLLKVALQNHNMMEYTAGGPMPAFMTANFMFRRAIIELAYLVTQQKTNL